ncbi:release factor glutamine methyltransferase [Spirochaetota bacterium]|nr:release factor glutamine methyltransferase [Spirochaetota bacterium]
MTSLEIYNKIYHTLHPKTYSKQTRHMLALNLIAEVLTLPPHKVLFTDRAKSFSLTQRLRIDRYLHALNRGVPVGYVLGTTEFCKLKFLTPRGVFLPRVETEELASHLIATLPSLLKKLEKASRTSTHHPSLLDIGTGTGVLAITLKKHFPTLNVTAIDTSTLALRTAQTNAKRLLPNTANNRIEFYHCDIFREFRAFAPLAKQTQASNKTHAPFKERIKTLLNKLFFINSNPVLDRYDIIVSNPPYIGENDPDLAPTVQHYEPAAALYSGADGLNFLRALAEHLPQILSRQGYFYLECGHNQTQPLSELFQSYQNLTFHKDMFSKHRFISGQCP